MLNNSVYEEYSAAVERTFHDTSLLAVVLSVLDIMADILHYDFIFLKFL